MDPDLLAASYSLTLLSYSPYPSSPTSSASPCPCPHTLPQNAQQHPHSTTVPPPSPPPPSFPSSPHCTKFCHCAAGCPPSPYSPAYYCQCPSSPTPPLALSSLRPATAPTAPGTADSHQATGSGGIRQWAASRLQDKERSSVSRSREPLVVVGASGSTMTEHKQEPWVTQQPLVEGRTWHHVFETLPAASHSTASTSTTTGCTVACSRCVQQIAPLPSEGKGREHTTTEEEGFLIGCCKTKCHTTTATTTTHHHCYTPGRDLLVAETNHGFLSSSQGSACSSFQGASQRMHADPRSPWVARRVQHLRNQESVDSSSTYCSTSSASSIGWDIPELQTSGCAFPEEGSGEEFQHVETSGGVFSHMETSGGKISLMETREGAISHVQPGSGEFSCVETKRGETSHMATTEEGEISSTRQGFQEQRRSAFSEKNLGPRASECPDTNDVGRSLLLLRRHQLPASSASSPKSKSTEKQSDHEQKLLAYREQRSNTSQWDLVEPKLIQLSLSENRDVTPSQRECAQEKRNGGECLLVPRHHTLPPHALACSGPKDLDKRSSYHWVLPARRELGSSAFRKELGARLALQYLQPEGACGEGLSLAPKVHTMPGGAANDSSQSFQPDHQHTCQVYREQRTRERRNLACIEL